MRIFQILEFNQFNTGSVHQMFQAAAGLRERGHDVTIVSRPDDVLASKAAEADVRFVGLPMRHEFDVISAWKLGRLFREVKPDAVHVHKGVAHSLALAATFQQPVRAFVVNRGVSFPLDVWNRIKYRTRRVSRVVTVCEQIKDVIVTSGGLPREKVVVIYAGTDVARFDPGKWDARAFRREKGIADDRFLIAQVGVRTWKGWKELIDAVASILPTHPQAHLALIGCRNASEQADVDAYAGERGVRRTSRRSSIATTCPTFSRRAIWSWMHRGPVPESPARSARRWPCASRSSPRTAAETASWCRRPRWGG